MTTTPELPALPEPHVLDGHWRDHINSVSGYTAAQMRAYALSTIAASRGQEDAARYRYARRFLSAHMIRNSIGWSGSSDSPEYMALVDAAIDAARQQEEDHAR